MATTLYLKYVASGTYWTSRGADQTVTVGATSYNSALAQVRLLATSDVATTQTTSISTVAGPTSPIAPANRMMWVTDPLAADVTISGTVSFAWYGYESNMLANCAAAYAIYKVDGATGVWTLIVAAKDDAELGTGIASMTWTASPSSTDCHVGDRIVAIPQIDDASQNMGNGYTATFEYGNSQMSVAFTETLSFISSAPSGSTYYLRDTASDIDPGSAVEKALSTTAGSSATTVTHTTVAGPLTFPGDQWTATAGGSDVEWYTPQLNAFTLSGAVRFYAGTNITPWDVDGSPYVSAVLEVAVVNGDGSSPTIWARSFWPLTHAGATHEDWLTGDNLAVTDGQRLRLRIYQDDWYDGTTVAASGSTQTLRYNGGSGVDLALITLTQTVTEYTPPTPYGPPFTRRDRRVVPLI